MGDIIKEHRTMKVMVDSLERTIKSQKRKLVEHDNLIENLQKELNSLKVQLLKGGNRSCLFES